MIKKMFLAVMVVSALVSCTTGNIGNPSSNLTLQLSGLEPLGDDFVYEGWLIVNGAPVSTGVFSSVDFPQTFSVKPSTLHRATKFVLSIEPANDVDPAPSMTKILVGDFTGNVASVSSNGVVGDFSNASGKYILATPTNGGDTDELSGIWYLDLSSGTPEVGLDLPVLDGGWKYEGWVVIDGVPVSTGTFSDIADFDDNAMTSPFKGDMGDGPAFPGEDFLQNAPSGLSFPLDLRGYATVISVEPYPDNSPAPFTLKPLLHIIPENADDHVTIPMEDGPLAELTGTVVR